MSFRDLIIWTFLAAFWCVVLCGCGKSEAPESDAQVLAVFVGGLGFNRTGPAFDATAKGPPPCLAVDMGWDGWAGSISAIVRDNPKPIKAGFAHSWGCQTLLEADRIEDFDLIVLADPVMRSPLGGDWLTTPRAKKVLVFASEFKGIEARHATIAGYPSVVILGTGHNDVPVDSRVIAAWADELAKLGASDVRNAQE